MSLSGATVDLTEYDKFGQQGGYRPVGRIRKPQTQPGPVCDVLLALRQLHLLAGEPSMRTIARSTGVISHDTVHRVLAGQDLPKWGPMELVVEALDGDVEAFRALWVTARQAMDDGYA